MVREAYRAGLSFDTVKLRALNCYPDDEENKNRFQPQRKAVEDIPDIEVDTASPIDLVTEPFGRRGAEAQESKIRWPIQQPKASKEVA
jgi:hypothetical protein